MKDAVFTWITNGNTDRMKPNFCSDQGIAVFINSLDQSGFKGDKVVFTVEMSKELRSILKDRGYIIVDVPKEEVHALYRDRHLAYYKWNTQNQYRYIVELDSRDTLIQLNPIEFLKVIKLTEFVNAEFIFLTAEGFKHKDSLTNLSNQKHYQDSFQKHQQDPSNWPVLNGGTLIGSAKRVLQFDLAIWLAGTGRIAPHGDQAITNYVYNYVMILDHSVTVMRPDYSRWCCTGEGMNIDELTSVPYWENGQLIYPGTGKPYFLFHQWDRTAFADEIRKKYT